MSKQLQWAIGGLALLIIGFVVLQIYLHVDMKQFKEELAGPEPKTETETEQPPEQVQVPEVDKRPPPPDDGHKYEWHHNHWDRVDVPLKVDLDTQREPNANVSNEVVYPKPDNPIKALREYAENKGHWSAKWIPEFPPDDVEAANFAQNILIMLAHTDAGNTILDGPADTAFREYVELLERYRTSTDQRRFDLLKLTWILLDAPPGDPKLFRSWEEF